MQSAPLSVPGIEAIVHDFLVATAEGNTDRHDAVSALLALVRDAVGMDIAFVSEFIDGKREFRAVSGGESRGIAVGRYDALEETYCQRVVDGRLPRGIANTADFHEALQLGVTEDLDIRSYLSAPVVLSDGQVYGTVCCIGHQPIPMVESTHMDLLNEVAKLVASEVESSRLAH